MIVPFCRTQFVILKRLKQEFSFCRLSLTIECCKVGKLDEKTVDFAFELTKDNMEQL